MVNVKKLVFISILLLNICSTFVVFAYFQTETKTEYSIDIRGYTWNNSTISVSILPQENETWWKPSYLNASLHGIAQWNDAIQEFASNHPDFSYLSNVHLVPTISQEVVSGFNIYINWRAMCESEATIGETQATVQSSCTFVKNTVYIAANAPSGHVMSEVDIQNIIVHEIGHTFGLSHTNYSIDVMYPTVYYRGTVKQLSSLDLYALSQILGWMTNSTQFSSPIICPEESVLTMPSNITYSLFQIAAENLPVSSQNLNEYIIGLFTLPETLPVILVTFTLIVDTVLILKRKKVKINS